MNSPRIPPGKKPELTPESENSSKKEEILDPDSRWLLSKANWLFAGVLVWLTYQKFKDLADRILGAAELTKFQATVIVFIILAWTLLVLTGFYFLFRTQKDDDWK